VIAHLGARLGTVAAALAALVALAMPRLEAQEVQFPAPQEFQAPKALLGSRGPRETNTLPEPLIYLRDIDPSILQDMRYAGPDNFTGGRVPGYDAGECLLLREAADALARVQQALRERQLSRKVYDCYRPSGAVRAFVAWGNEEGAGPDPLLKRFHPNISRSRLIEDGYVAAVSHHSRGDTVDLTLVELPVKPVAPFQHNAAYGSCIGPAKDRAPDNSVDMGTGFDCFDPLSHTRAPDITAAQARWRQILVEAMAGEGFRNYRKEWWHFTLVPARAARSFNVPIVPRP
jgi:D-alanyl-D-alanine dipeptidase